MDVSDVELPELSNNVILSEIKDTLSRQPLLRKIYDDQVVRRIVDERFRRDRTLLWYLVSNAQHAQDFWAHIVRWLSLLGEEEAVAKFKSKLVDPKEFRHSIIELEFAGRYKDKGYSVELEPLIPGKNTLGDFRVLTDPPVYFECKSVSLEFLQDQEGVMDKLRQEFHKFEEPLVINIVMEKGLKEMHLGRLRKATIEEAKRVSENRLPHQFLFRHGGADLAEVEIAGTTKRRYGYLGVIHKPGTVIDKEDFERVRKKIGAAMKQFPAGFPCVLILGRENISISDFVVQNSLYGDYKVSIDVERRSSQSFRDINGIFRPNKNTRLAAVFFLKRGLGVFECDTETDMNMYHNRFASKKLTEDSLKGLCELKGLRVKHYCKD